MYHIIFKFADAMSNWEWITRHCIVDSLEECKRIYGLDNGDVVYEIIKMEKVE